MRMVGVPEMSFDYWAAQFIAKGYVCLADSEKPVLMAIYSCISQIQSGKSGPNGDSDRKEHAGKERGCKVRQGDP